jgi:PIN domain nuclease of toxin-antitoxin system
MQICQDVWTSLTDKNVFIGPGVLNHFIPDLMPDSLQYDGGKIVISLLRLVSSHFLSQLLICGSMLHCLKLCKCQILDRSVLCWWQDDPVVQQFSKDYTEASEQAMNEVGHNPEIQFEMNCRMKENILVRAMVMPSYFVALMTSNLWPLPQLHVNIADEDRMWMQTNLLLKMYLVKRDLESRADLHKGPSIQDAYWSTNEDTRKTNEVSLYGDCH